MADYDYLDQLNEDQLAWLADFHDEWTGTRISKRSLHNPGQMCENYANDFKRRESIEEFRVFPHGNPGILQKNPGSPEDAIIQLIDMKAELKKANK